MIPTSFNNPEPIIFLRVYLTLILSLFCVALCAQTTFTSTGAGGDWETGSTWDQGGSTPGNNDHVVIADGDIVTITTGTGNVVITDVTIQGTGILDWLGDRRLNVNGDLTMSGTSSITGSSNNHRLELGGDFDIPSGTASIGGIRITVDGTTTIGTNSVTTATLSFTSVDGNKTFTGITVNENSTWDNNSLEDFNIDGNIVANAGITWTGCSAFIGCRYTIRATSSVSGAGTVTFSDIRVNDNVTFTNDGALVVTDDIDGQAGTNAFLINNGTLTLSENGTYSEITFDLDNDANTVIYSGGGNEDMNLGPFHDLEINKTDATTQCDVDGTNITVNGTMTITQGIVRVRSANTLLVTENLNVNGGELTILTNASAVVDVNGSVVVGGGEIDQNIGTLDVAGGVTVNSGTLSVNTATSFNVVGTYQASGGTNDFNSGTATLGALTVDAGETATVGGIDITVSGATTLDGTLTIDGNTGDKNLTNLTLTNSGNLNFTSNETVNVSGNLNMSGNSSVTGTNAARTLNVTGTFDVPSGTASFSGVTLDVMGLTTVAGTLDLTNTTGTKSLDALTLNSGIVQFSASETLTVDGVMTITGTSSINGNAATGTLSANSTLNVPSGTATIADVNLTVAGLSTVAGNVVVSNGSGSKSLGNLTMSSAGNINFTAAETLSIGGNLSMSGTSSITGTANNQIVTVTGTFDVTGGTASVGGVRFTMNGTTTLDGVLAFTSASGNKTFVDVVVNGSGNWNNGTVAEDFTISGSITNNGSWTGCVNNGCDYTLTNATGTISGSGAMNATSDVIINTGASYRNTNTGGLFITDRLTGTGEFINDTNGSLNYSGNNNAGANFDITTFTASASGNTMTYARAGDMQLRTTSDTDNNYHNLVIDTDAGGDDVTMVANVTVDNLLTFTQGEIVLDAFNLTMGAGATMSGGSATSYANMNGAGRVIQNYSGVATSAILIGEGNQYSPVNSFEITQGTFGASPSVTFSITDANHPNRDTDNTGAGGDDDGTAAVAYISRYWTVSPNDITSARYNASYTYLDADITGTEANMVGVVYRTPSGESFMDWRVQGVVNASTNTVLITNMDAFGDLYAMDNTTDRLPIVLLSFDAEATESTVELEWVTVSEENNDFYTVERSQDGVNFDEVLTVAGAGNSNNLLYYQAVDNDPLIGRSFYRLKQTDFNGGFEYSEMRSVLINHISVPYEIKLFPNPVNRGSILKIEFEEFLVQDSNSEVVLMDLRGKRVKSIALGPQVKRHVEFHIPSGLDEGIYLLSLINNGKSVRQRLWVK